MTTSTTGLDLANQARDLLHPATRFEREGHLPTFIMWSLATHGIDLGPKHHDAITHAPRLWIDAPMGSGKSVVIRSGIALGWHLTKAGGDLTHAAMRTLAAAQKSNGKITERGTGVFIDEADRGRGGEMRELINSLINAGFDQDGTVQATVVQKDGPLTVEEIHVFAPLAQVGRSVEFKDDVRTRFIRIAPVEAKRTDPQPLTPMGDTNERLNTISHKFRTWLLHNGIEPLTDATVDPRKIEHHRDLDTWRPLLAVADTIGGDWPNTIRAECYEQVAAMRAEFTSTPDARSTIHDDLRRALPDLRKSSTNGLIPSTALAHELIAVNGALFDRGGPYPLRRKGDDQVNGAVLRKVLAPTGIEHTRTMAVRGYRLADIERATTNTEGAA